MTTKLTVLFAPGYGRGRLNASHGFASELSARGHRIVFSIDKTYGGQLARHGFEEILHLVDQEITRQSGGEQWHHFVTNNAEALKGNSMHIFGGYGVKKMANELRECKSLDQHYRSVIQAIKPDVIVVDASIYSPAIITCGIPYVCLTSEAPLLALNDPTLPPPFSGMSLKGDIKDWHKFGVKLNEIFEELRQDINNWYMNVGAQQLAPNHMTINSPYLNIYVLPKELDYYSNNTLLPQNWFRVDSLLSRVCARNDSFAIPAKLCDKRGKLILINMGRVGTDDVTLMRKLIDNVSHSDHRYIMITGNIGDELEMPANVWGKAYLPIVEVLPQIDLLISNGSNQSIIEALYYGKPLIVLPLFGNQFESAQRVKELALGLTLNPYTCGMTSLIASVDALVGDINLKKRLNFISQRMQISTEMSRAAQMLENVVNINI